MGHVEASGEREMKPHIKFKDGKWQVQAWRGDWFGLDARSFMHAVKMARRAYKADYMGTASMILGR